MNALRSLGTVLGFAAVTAAFCLSVALPRATYADDEQLLVERTASGTRIASVLVRGHVERDAKAKSGWVVVVDAENGGATPQTVALETDLTRTVSNPMARVAPMPATVWSKRETVTLGPREKIAKRYEVPAALAKELTAAARASAEPAPNVGISTQTRFAVAFKGAAPKA